MAQRSKFIGAPSRNELWEPQEKRAFTLAQASAKVNKAPIFLGREKRDPTVKYMETVRVFFFVTVQKQLLSLGVHTVAGVQTGNCRSTLKFMFLFIAFLSSVFAFSPFSTSLQNALQGAHRGRCADNR